MEAKISMDQIRQGRWALIPRALQRLEQSGEGDIDLNKLTIEEIDEHLVLKI
jgi:hypothetical protein